MAPPFASSEHQYIGNIDLPKLGDQHYLFTLSNGVKLTFGSIIALAGDYYGVPEQPISLGGSETERAKRFLAAFDTLDKATNTKDLQDLIDMIKAERKTIDDAIRDKRSIPAALDGCAFKATVDSIENTDGLYVELAKHNLDHFGAQALAAYKTGHLLALQTAADGKLERAYALEAFACHFLTDLFAAGHIRTPRKELYDLLGVEVGSFFSLLQHNEDGGDGLAVCNDLGQNWIAYGDGHLFEEKSAENRIKVNEAVKTAVAELYAAYTSKKVPETNLLGIFKHIPRVVKEKSISPLFIYRDDKLFYRADIDDKSCQKYNALTKSDIVDFLGRYAEETLEETPLYKQAEASFKHLSDDTKKFFRNNGNPTLFKRKKEGAHPQQPVAKSGNSCGCHLL